MKTNRTPRGLPRRMHGVSMVELLIAMALGLVVLGALATLFANSSRSRAELERNSRQIENGRFAMELLTEDLRMAGFYGELNVAGLLVPATSDPCDLTPANWAASIPVHVQGYDNGAGLPPGCPVVDLKPGTDVVAIRRVAMCEAGVNGCPAAVNTRPYFQATRCQTELPGTPYKLDMLAGGAFNLHTRNCTTVAGLRQYIVRIYYISTNNGYGQAIPTLKRLEFTGTGFTDTPLVEGIEELNIEYGIDNAPATPDGVPDVYTTAPGSVAAFANAMTARIYLLARNIESSPGYTDTKTYYLGKDAGGNPISIRPGGDVRRHAYSGLVRIVNPANRRDTP